MNCWFGESEQAARMIVEPGVVPVAATHRSLASMYIWPPAGWFRVKSSSSAVSSGLQVWVLYSLTARCLPPHIHAVKVGFIEGSVNWMKTGSGLTVVWVGTEGVGIGVEVASAAGVEVGVGAIVSDGGAGIGVAVDAAPQAMISTGNRVRGTTKIDVGICEALSAFLRQVFDPLQVSQHVALVMFTSAG